jgi:protocatechuate 3,4-dioxygenase beta subunit
MRNLRIAILCAGSLFVASDLRAQEVIVNRTTTDFRGEMQLPGMGPRQVKTGTARLRGRITALETGGPVRRAQVRISGPDIGSKGAVTDAEGRFEFRDLPAGRFNVSAAKSGFVSVQFGQLRPFESGKSIDLVDGQLMDKADIAMPRGGVVSGRLVDEFGDPIADAVVSAMRSAWAGGRRRLVPSGRTAMTNDLGQFRIYGLSPGDYYVSATFRGDVMGMEIMATMGGMAAGGPTGSNPNSGYAPTYFPGTPNGAEAQKVVIAAGQEAQNTDFALLPVKLAKISGTVINSEGKPVEGAMINAVPRSGDGMGMMMANAARSDKNGNFTIANVAPGDYTLHSRALTIMTSGSGDNMMFAARLAAGGGGSDAETGAMPLSLAGDDISGVVIVTSKGASVTGHVRFEGGAKPTALTAIRISASAADSDGPAMMFGGGGTTVKADGSFELQGLSGTRLLRAVNLPPGWMLKEVRVNGADVTDTGVDLKAGEAIAGAEIVLTAKVTELKGTVTAAGPQLVKDYTLAVFSEDPLRWTLPASRYVTSARPDQEGRFQVKSLPAGAYYAIAVEYLAQGEWNDPEVLERLKANATRFALREGETKVLELRLK